MPTPRLSRRSFALAATALAASPRPAWSRIQVPDPHNPMRAAEELSGLEITEHIPALYTFYDRMHPDAQAIIPRHVVVRYFREVFQPRKPKPAVATGVTYRDWTWGVNGVTYPETAEVSFTQEFAAGTISDVVRLVQHDGTWRWFFGRDRGWVEEQILRFSQTLTVPEEGTVPLGLERARISNAMLNRLPERLDSATMASRLAATDPRRMPLPGWANGQASLQFVAEDEPYPVGFVQVLTLADTITVPNAIRAQVEDVQARPPFTLQGWNLAPDNDVPFADTEIFGSDAVGMARTIWWGAAEGRHVAVISHADAASLEAIATAIAGSA